jgi:hypothetical protein
MKTDNLNNIKIALNLCFNIAKASFYSKKLYNNIYYKWNKFPLTYIILLLFLSIIPNIFAAISLLVSIDVDEIRQYQEDNFIQNNESNINLEIANVINQMPNLDIINGVITNDYNEIIYIKDLNDNRHFLAIDLENKLDPTASELPKIIINKDSINIIDSINHNNTINYKLDKIFNNAKSYRIDGFMIIDAIEIAVNKAKWFIPLIYLPLLLITSIFLYFAKTSFYSICGSFYTKIFNKNPHLKFKQLLNVALIAGTPSIIFATLLSLLPIYNILFMQLSYWVIMLSSVFYFVFAINSCLEDKMSSVKNTD